MKEWLKKLVEDERRNAPSCASLYSPGFHAQLNEEGGALRPRPSGPKIQTQEKSEMRDSIERKLEAANAEIARLRADLAQRDRKIAELERGSEDNSDSWRDEAVVLDAEVVKLDAEIARLREELAQYDKWIPALCRELPCGAHPRLLSLGQPARFSGGCGSALIAPEAIVCADCGAWYCSRECISKHFGNEPSEAISSLECQLAQVRQERDALMGNPDAVHQGAAHAIEALRQVEKIKQERDAAVAAMKQFVGVIVRRQEQLKTGSGVAIASILGIARELFHKYQMTGNEPKPPAWVEAAREVVKARLLKSNPSVWRAVNQLVNAAPESWRK